MIAESEGVKLYVKRERPGVLSIGIGDTIGITGSVDELAKFFSDHDVHVLGRAPTAWAGSLTRGGGGRSLG